MEQKKKKTWKVRYEVLSYTREIHTHQSADQLRSSILDSKAGAVHTTRAPHFKYTPSISNYKTFQKSWRVKTS
jgi:hypothetical protein